jgi:hypothetical protein
MEAAAAERMIKEAEAEAERLRLEKKAEKLRIEMEVRHNEKLHQLARYYPTTCEWQTHNFRK